MILRVPSGIYIVKASTQSCAQAKGQKIAASSGVKEVKGVIAPYGR